MKIICRRCERILNKSNWNPSRKKWYIYLCHSCEAELTRIRRQNNPKYYREYSRNWHRKNTLHTGDKTIKVMKRTHPGKCELCGNSNIRLQYHHWLEKQPGIGMWICNPCHIFAERYEKGYLPEYLEFKRRLINAD